MEAIKRAAQAFAEGEQAIREIEAKRKEMTRPLDASKKIAIEEERKAVAAIEALRQPAVEALVAYATSPDTQEALAEVRHLQLKGREYMKEGDAEGLALVASKLEAIDVRPSIAVEGGYVRFSTRPLILKIDQEKLPERYWVKVVDEKRIIEDFKLMGSVTGVEIEPETKPVFVEKKG